MQLIFCDAQTQAAPLNPEKFDATWRAQSTVQIVRKPDVLPFCRLHYLRKPPALETLCLMLYVGPEPMGCIIYALPPREIETRYGGATWELARLFLLDRVPRNGESWFIAQSIKVIRRHYPHVKFLVSYADSAAGHQGLIYRASNWRPDGHTDEGRNTPRFDLQDVVTGKKYGRASHVPPGAKVQRLARSRKNRFVYALH